MNPEDRIELLQWIRTHREYDGQDSYFIDADELEEWLLGIDRGPVELQPAPVYEYVSVPVVAGVATLPDGRTVRSSANVVRVPILPSDKDSPR
jgi:hypothetical protein